MPHKSKAFPAIINASECRPEVTQAGENEKKRCGLFTTKVIYVLAVAPKAVDYFLLWQTWGWFVELRIKLIYSEPLTSGGNTVYQPWQVNPISVKQRAGQAESICLAGDRSQASASEALEAGGSSVSKASFNLISHTLPLFGAKLSLLYYSPAPHVFASH